MAKQRSTSSDTADMKQDGRSRVERGLADIRQQVTQNNDVEAAIVQHHKLLAGELRTHAADGKAILEIADRLEQDAKPISEAVFANTDTSPRHADGTRPDHTTGIDTLHGGGRTTDGVGSQRDVNDLGRTTSPREV